MAARLAIGIDPRERLQRLSVVFAVELRLKIVSELYGREMSATQFYEEFGGGTPTRVKQNFTRLAETGWLRLTRSVGPGGSLHGGVEQFYRATEPAFFDADSWALVPYSLRVAETWNVFKQIAPRLRGALELACTETQYGRELTCDQFDLDELGWKRVIKAIDAQFVALFDEQHDARLRTLHGGGPLIPADVFLVAFESPSGNWSTGDGSLVEQRKEPLASFYVRLSPVLGNELLMQIVGNLNQQEMSVTQFCREVGSATTTRVRRGFKGLSQGGWVAQVGQKHGGRRRGATEHFYRATKPAFLDFRPHANPSEALQNSSGWAVYQRFCEEAINAMRAGTFDARKDRYVTWSSVSLDDQGWRGVVAGVDSLHEFIAKEEVDARQRMNESGEKPITMTVALAALRALKQIIKAP